MEELRRRVGKIWRACDSPSRKNSTSHLFWLVQTCSNLFTPVHTCSHLTDYLHSSHNGNFPLGKLLFSILCAIFLKLHIFAHLIESYPTMHGLSSCIEIIMSTPLAAHTTVTMYACLKMSILCPFEGSHSSVLRRILLKLHILTRLIESFPTLCGLWSCIEVEMSIPLGAHA